MARKQVDELRPRAITVAGDGYGNPSGIILTDVLGRLVDDCASPQQPPEKVGVVEMIDALAAEAELRVLSEAITEANVGLFAAPADAGDVLRVCYFPINAGQHVLAKQMPIERGQAIVHLDDALKAGVNASEPHWLSRASGRTLHRINQGTTAAFMTRELSAKVDLMTEGLQAWTSMDPGDVVAAIEMANLIGKGGLFREVHHLFISYPLQALISFARGRMRARATTRIRGDLDGIGSLPLTVLSRELNRRRIFEEVIAARDRAFLTLQQWALLTGLTGATATHALEYVERAVAQERAFTAHRSTCLRMQRERGARPTCTNEKGTSLVGRIF